MNSATRQSIGGANLCLSFLVASRHVAREHGNPTDKGFGVLDNGRTYYVVEGPDGKIVWEGDTHCRYCARTEAISAMAARKEAA